MTPEVEQWRPIPGQEGRYDISDRGNVRSWVPCRRLPIPRPVATHVGPAGYVQVTLYRNRVRTYCTTHALMALAFIGPRPDGQEVRHLDGSRTNNRLSNLAYGSVSENRVDSVEHGTHNNARKVACKHGHPFDAANTYIRPNGRRECRTCAVRRERTRIRTT